MNPAFSVITFTLVAGAAQGLVVALAMTGLFGVSASAGFLSRTLMIAVAMLVIGLGASFAHLGRPERAWRAATMWRTSWLSREVIVLPAFIAVVSVWCLSLRSNPESGLAVLLLPALAIVVSAFLWYCTAMIYACLRFIEEWAHPLTVANFILVGMSSGLVLCCALASNANELVLAAVVAPAALFTTLVAWMSRVVAMRRNFAIRHRSTLQTAIGVHAPLLKQTSMGMSAGSFNTREFFHHASAAAVRHVRWAGQALGFGVPAALLAWGWISGAAVAWPLAVVVQATGLMADRWLFFAEAKHPQNLYYQVVS